MKADVFIAKTTMDNSGDQMLAGMLLHEHKTAIPVNFALYGFIHRERRVAKMNDLAVAVKDIKDIGGMNRAEITGLTAAGRVENRLI